MPRAVFIDHDWIARQIPAGARVLDLGCGDGTLLRHLAAEKGVNGTGIDISPTCVQACIEKGLPAIEGDIDDGLHDYPDKAFDYVVLCRTLHLVKQPLGVLAEALRVGNVVAISFENEAYWRKRLRFLLKGDLPADRSELEVPTTAHLRNFLTVAKMEKIVTLLGAIVKTRCFSKNFQSGTARRNPNLQACIALYLLTRPS